MAERAGGAPGRRHPHLLGTYKADLAVRAFLLYATLKRGPGKGPFGDQRDTP